MMFPANTRILVVDDMKTMRLVMKKSLTQLGFTSIAEADDGETAWPMIQQAAGSGQPFQLILSDWNMPKMKGLDLLKLVRGHETLKVTPFILVTAESEGDQVKLALTSGVSHYIVKPFTADTLAERLKAVYAKISGGK
jgi:two-component system, chemotaxis family, chemotaxis protein CheY